MVKTTTAVAVVAASAAVTAHQTLFVLAPGQGATVLRGGTTSHGAYSSRFVAAPRAAVSSASVASAALVPFALCGCAGAFVRRQSRRQRSQRELPQSRDDAASPVAGVVALRAYTSAPQTYEGAPIGPPPDLPSLLLKNRIVFLGTPITNEVTELIIAQLLYLNYESADKPVTLYINSTGSTVKNNTRYIGENKVGLETDAFAIADCMRYIKPQVTTICIGQAYGTAALLMGLGAKGKRFALPNATIMLAEPREPPARGAKQASDLRILAKEVLNNRSTMGALMATATGRSAEEFMKDTQRCKYMTPDEAVTYGLLDKVLTPEKLKADAGQDMPNFIKAL